MTVVGVSAEGFAGIDPAQSPQIRVPVPTEPVMLPDLGWLHMDDRRVRWVQVFGRLKPGYTVETAQGPLQGLFTRIRADQRRHRPPLTGRNCPRPLHEGAAAGRERGARLLAAPQ